MDVFDRNHLAQAFTREKLQQDLAGLMTPEGAQAVSHKSESTLDLSIVPPDVDFKVVEFAYRTCSFATSPPIDNLFRVVLALGKLKYAWGDENGFWGEPEEEDEAEIEKAEFGFVYLVYAEADLRLLSAEHTEEHESMFL